MKTGFLEEAPGVKSSTRLQMMLTLILAFVVTIYQVYAEQVDIVLIGLLFVAATTPKAVSKFAERIPMKK